MTDQEEFAEKLTELSEQAFADAHEARQALIDGAYTADGNDFNRGGEVATACALLAIEGRLAIATLFIVAAMKEDEPHRVPGL